MKDAELKFRLPEELKASFLATCEDNDQPAAQVLRAAVRSYIESHAKPQGDLLKPAKPKRKA
jgi:predicted DNA-binding protein